MDCVDFILLCVGMVAFLATFLIEWLFGVPGHIRLLTSAAMGLIAHQVVAYGAVLCIWIGQKREEARAPASDTREGKQ
jgi:hypothetical protein